MKPLSWDKQLGLASPRESAASQSDQTNNPSKNEVRNEVGLDVRSPHPHLPEGRGESFFLTSSLIGRVIWRFRQQDTSAFSDELPHNDNGTRQVADYLAERLLASPLKGTKGALLGAGDGADD